MTAYHEEEPEQLREICSGLQRVVTEEKGLAECVVVVAPPFGLPYCSVGHDNLGGDCKPSLVIWLLLDPTDIDSKQTTFVKKTAVEELDMVFGQLYRLKV
jgi:hypothetical protein